MACPTCGKGTSSFRLPNCRKICYMDYRCFLPLNHKWRDSKTFDGKVERRPAPKPLCGDEMLAQMSGLEDLKFGKDVKHPKRADNWRKISIFFELPYWSRLLLRHNLDVMHIEKNVFDNILGTLLDIRGKSKDHIKARHDLKKLRIRKKLHPKLINGKWHIPPAMYTLSPGEKDKVCKFLEEVKVPDGYSSNFSKCIKKRKVSGLQTHDCHVLLQQLLPLAIRGISCQQVYDLVVELGIFFKELCSKSLNVEDLDCLENHIIVTLCKLEKVFLPSFFDVMVHLCVHFVGEAKIGGPVQSRWMYPIERFLGKLKDYIRNKARPEGSIAKGYILEECLFFCSKYLHNVETKSNQQERNSDSVSDDYEGLSIFAPSGVSLGKEKSKCLTQEEWEKARDYVLKNCDEVQPFLREYEQGQNENEFSEWFRERFAG
ncbi:uncharacterized protein LOC110709416 isoform X2 [Chenopodium quinoa]|uniref:uncharacterized protein LOC110709416 isoform X2 n=1 Tax=Chenopodium quinoa TaxID=63459 RepID=UPI000B797C2C|nr:uncharacterized protein LOC110709416 isoform X2 [Chenopodium quinoa]